MKKRIIALLCFALGGLGRAAQFNDQAHNEELFNASYALDIARVLELFQISKQQGQQQAFRDARTVFGGVIALRFAQSQEDRTRHYEDALIIMRAMLLAGENPVLKNLFDAIKYGYIGIVLFLLEDCGISAQQYNDAGMTPFLKACERGHVEIAQQLLTHGSELTEVDTWGRTALMIALQHAKLEMVRFLLSKGASLAARDCEGNTLLHAMANYSNPFTGHDEQIAEQIWQRDDKKNMIAAFSWLQHNRCIRPGSGAVVQQERVLFVGWQGNNRPHDGSDDVLRELPQRSTGSWTSVFQDALLNYCVTPYVLQKAISTHDPMWKAAAGVAIAKAFADIASHDPVSTQNKGFDLCKILGVGISSCFFTVAAGAVIGEALGGNRFIDKASLPLLTAYLGASVGSGLFLANTSYELCKKLTT